MAARKCFHLLMALACGLFLSIITPAQGPTTGRVEGIVTDPNGAIVAAVEVTSLNESTGEKRTTITDTLGNYALPLLPPGRYRLTFALRGFATAAYSAQVIITQTTRVDARLELAGADTVTVDVPSTVHANGPQLGQAVDSRFTSELPLASRNFTQILSLSPGVATYLPDSTGVGRNTQTISVNGARMTQNNVQMNGIDANTMGTSAAVNIAIPAPETIQEFKVQTSMYDASFGRSGGGNVQVVTRSGGNDFHGTSYEYFRDDALNANNPFLKAAGVGRPVLNRNVFGGTVGGPLRRQKAFFFASYQGTREKNGASILNSISSSVLIDPKLTDDRSQSFLTATYGFPVHPAALALLNAKLPDGQFVIPTPQVNGRYFGSSISRFTENQFNANVDYRLSEKNALSAKFFFADAPFFLALPSFRGTGANVPGFGANQAGNVRVLALQDVHALSSRTYNELRLGYNLHRNYISPSEPINDSDLRINRSTATAYPGLGLIRIAPAAGGIVIGTPTNISPAFAWVTTVNDTLALDRGRHFIRVGGEFRFNEVNFAQQQFSWGQIDFQNFESFLKGITLNSTLGGGVGNRRQRALDYNLFFQDDWKASPRLTINLGVRYELDLPPYDTRGRISTFDPLLYQPRFDSNGNVIGPPAAGFVQAGNVIPQYDLANVPNVSKYVIRGIDGDNFAPRLGFAYAPGEGRLVVRGGYGIYHSRPTFQYISTSVTAPPGYLLARRGSAALDNPFFNIPSQPPFPKFVDGVPLSGTVLDRNIRTPYLHQYNASARYEIARNTIIETAYAGTLGRNLFRQVAINQARLASPQHPIVDATGAAITTNTPANAASRASFQGVDISGLFQNQTTAKSSYNSLQISLTSRIRSDIQVLACYTYAKSMDNASGTGGGAGIVGIVNPGGVADTSMILGNQLDDNANRGVSDFDRTHRFVFSYLWDIAKSRKANAAAPLRVLASNWQLSGIIIAMSGLPIDIVDTGAGSFFGLSGGATPLARPNWNPGNTPSSAISSAPPGYFFNPFAFARPAVTAGQTIPSSNSAARADALGTDIGNVGRNVLRGPAQVNFDLAVIKRFPFREAKNIELRAEFFNVFNHVNFANPISNFNAVPSSSINSSSGRITGDPGDFGRVISTSNNPRLIELVVKINF